MQGQCEPNEFFAEYYRHTEGWAEFCGYCESVTHWNGREHLSIAETNLRKGHREGKKAAITDLKQDKYKTLFINDTIQLHDLQHVVMLEATGLQRKLTGEFWNILVHFRHFFEISW